MGIWHLSDAPGAASQLGSYQQTVAAGGAIKGGRLPLILMSHGTDGSLSSHLDTAAALAKAGFVVAAPTHTGDNFQDQSYAGNWRDLIDRPRQVRKVLSFLIDSWPGRDHLDSSRASACSVSRWADSLLW